LTFVGFYALIVCKKGKEIMAPKKTSLPSDAQRRVIAEARRYQAEREQTYRAQALKIYPWVCGRCGREFEGKKLRELTVHHRDHNHDNNPPDGSNWELLCLYCHENEHARQQVADAYGEATPGEDREPPSTYKPFADLEKLLQRKTSSR
jgi:histone acetyltransferase (RNA polymerase elongator complex component)